MGSKITEVDLQGSNSLHHALSWGNHQIAAILLKQGSDPNIKNLKGWTPLDYCYNSRLVDYVLDCVKNIAENKSIPAYEDRASTREKSVVNRNSFLATPNFIKLPSLSTNG